MNPWDASRAEAKVPGLATASQSSCGESNTQKKLGKSALCVCVCVPSLHSKAEAKYYPWFCQGGCVRSFHVLIRQL